MHVNKGWRTKRSFDTELPGNDAFPANCCSAPKLATLPQLTANNASFLLGLRLQYHFNKQQGMFRGVTVPCSSVSTNDGSRVSFGNQPEACVPQLVSTQAAARPEHIALHSNGEALTYGELEVRSDQVADQLRLLGVGPEVVVGLCLDRSIGLPVAALGILKAGGAYLPLDPAHPSDRLAFMLRDAQAQILVTDADLAQRFPAGGCQVVELAPGNRSTARQAARARVDEALAQHLAYVIYTSGTTGCPKGVEITHASLSNLVSWHRRAFGVTWTDRASQLAGLSFDAAGWELWPYLTAGASVHLADDETRRSPELVRDWLVAQEITISFAPTPLAERMLTLEWPHSTALRVMLTGGDRLHRYPPPGLPFQVVNNYGPTECTVVATSGVLQPEEHRDVLPPIGWPIANTQVYILDDQQQPVAPGLAGHLYIGGAGLARGYRNDPALTVERFVPDRFSAAPDARLYRTGDLARFLPDGQLAFLGRADRQVKIRGYRIEPDEISALLNTHPMIEESLVVAREDTPGDKQLIAYVVPAVDSTPSCKVLREFLQAQLPDYMLPAFFVFLRSLPLTPNGKLDRVALPAPDASNSQTFVAPRTVMEQRLCGILKSLLNLERVGVEDNFFQMGGHSLLGAQVIVRVRDVFGVDLSLRDLFEHPNVGAMSAVIERVMIARLEAMSEEEARHTLAERE
jgi:amino acid adenylation domain-containing protein